MGHAWAMLQGLTDDWRVRLAFPVFQLIDFLLSRQRIARFLFNNFRTKDNLKKVLQVTALASCSMQLLEKQSRTCSACSCRRHQDRGNM